MSSDDARVTIYFDGACPLCRAEIDHYRSLDDENRLCFIDAAVSDAPLGPALTQTAALARFHVREETGALLSGASAFVRVWQSLPRWRWAARLARLPGALFVLEIGYRASLIIRPWIARIVSRRMARL
jgi:predicted DCC family thiol-disulfide oxidoreductase YuxK